MVRRICIIKRQQSRDIPARQAAASFRQVGQKIALVHAASLCAAAAALISNHVVTRLRGHCAGASPCPWRHRHRVTFSRRRRPNCRLAKKNVKSCESKHRCETLMQTYRMTPDSRTPKVCLLNTKGMRRSSFLKIYIIIPK